MILFSATEFCAEPDTEELQKYCWMPEILLVKFHQEDTTGSAAEVVQWL